MHSSRQLAVIMFTDIAGYTALMGKDEQNAFDLLRKNRQLQKPLIEKHGGKWIKEIGDGVLASFSTPTDAVQCAVAIQHACAHLPDLKLHIGIHLGEVVFEQGDVFGDGVNIASRLESLAPPGDVLISEAVYTNIRNKKEFDAEFYREETLKNVETPVKIYRVIIETGNAAQKANDHSSTVYRKGKVFKAKRLVPLMLGFICLLVIGWFLYFKDQSKPSGATAGATMSIDKSIAVLPFENMSNDPQQDYFANGMMDEILNHLFKIGGWRITSRTSAMAYKGSKKPMKEIARELGVTNLLEGSVQKVGDRIRVRVQLINGKNDEHLWAETYERDFKEVFAIQNDIAQNVANALQVTIAPDVKRRIERLPTQNTEAYNLYLQATDESILEGERMALLEKAIAIDPNFAEAYTLLARVWLSRGGFMGTLSSEEVVQKTLPLLQKALQIDPNSALAHRWIGTLYLWYKQDFKATEEEYLTVKKLNPSNTSVFTGFSDYLLATGRAPEALKVMQTALNNDKNSFIAWRLLAIAYYFNNNSKEALKTIETAMSLFMADRITAVGRNLIPHAVRIKVYTGNYADAIETIEKSNPALNIKNMPVLLGYTAIAYYKSGQKEKAESLLNELIKRSQKSSVGSPSFFAAGVYTAMGQKDLAIQSLEKAFKDREVEIYWLKVEPVLEPLHGDARFQSIVNRLKYPK